MSYNCGWGKKELYLIKLNYYPYRKAPSTFSHKELLPIETPIKKKMKLHQSFKFHVTTKLAIAHKKVYKRKSQRSIGPA